MLLRLQRRLLFQQSKTARAAEKAASDKALADAKGSIR
jgi:hypothetical protein